MQALESLLIANIVRSGVKILKERGNQLSAILRIKLGNFFE